MKDTDIGSLDLDVTGDIVKLEDFLEPSPNAIKNDDADLEQGVVDGTIENFLETPIEKIEKKLDLEVPSDTLAKEEVLKSSPTTINYKTIVDKMFKVGKWEKFDVLVDEEGNEVPYDELEIDEETFERIALQQEELREEKSSKENIAVNSLSDFTKRLIEIEKKGGSVTDALNAYQDVKAPLEQIDTTTIEGKRAVVYMLLKNKGQEDGDIRRLIKSYESENLLDDKAIEAEEELDNAYNKYLNSIEEQAVKTKEAKDNALKEYRKVFSENLGNSFQLKDSYKNKLIDYATKPDDNGRFELDKFYNEARKDPEKAVELALFLNNKEEYLKQVLSKKEIDKDISVLRKLNLLPKNTNKVNIDPLVNKKDSKNEIGLDTLFNS